MVGDSQQCMKGVGEQLFRQAVEATAHSIYFTDRNGVIQYVNPAFEEMTGYSAEKAIGNTPRLLKSGEHDQEFYQELWATILNGEVWRNELINQRKSGEKYVVDQTITPVQDETGEITHFVAINIDVTERYEYERHLERQNQELDRFSSILSHDVKNLLTVASGNTELAQETDDLSYLDNVREAHSRMLELADEMLTLARAGRIVDEGESVTLRDVISEAWATTETSEATLEMNVDAEITADRDRLKQVFENLFNNAIQHGGDDVSVRVGVEDDCLYIEDDGSGIEFSNRETVFEKGFSTRESGNGVGLAIVKSIVDAHGWTIAVTESDAGGARFEISGMAFGS